MRPQPKELKDNSLFESLGIVFYEALFGLNHDLKPYLTKLD